MVPQSQRKANHIHHASFSSLQSSSPSSPSPSPSLSSPSSSLLYNCSNSTYHTPARSFSCFEVSYSSSFSKSSASCITAASVLQPPQESLLSPMQHYQQQQDGLQVFVGEASCSSSDGSCSNQISQSKEVEYEYGGARGNNGENKGDQQIGMHSYNFYNEADENQKLMASNGGGGNEWSEKSSNGLWGETPLDYGLEELKQLINSSCNSFIFYENKEVEKVMYY
ncbi:hypothetical protein CRYUN_Cryun08bG0138500 [Craigia yunnanensis]